MSIRTNIVVSIDERGGSLELEALKVSTTSSATVVVVTIQDKRVTIAPDDLVDALEKCKQFLKDRPAQPKTPQIGGLTPDTIKVEDVSSEFSEN